MGAISVRPLVIASIVEGDGDVLALPKLLSRLAPEAIYPRPIRVPRFKIIREGVLERYLGIAQAAILERSGVGGCLILLDAEDDCPAILGPQLLQRAMKFVKGLPVQVVLAKRKFETWFLAGGVCPVPAGTLVEDIADPKVILRHSLGTYRETVDQPSCTSKIDIELATNMSASFRKLLKAMDAMQQATSFPPPA